MVQLLGLVLRLGREIHAEFFEEGGVDVREDDGRVGFTAAQAVELVDRDLGHRVRHRADRQRDQQLVGVQARVVVAEMLDLEVLDRLDDARRDQLELLVDARELFQGVEQAGGGGAEQRGGLTGDDAAVGS